MKKRFLVAALAFPVLLTGCVGDDEGKKIDSQVAVKVNGEEVTVHQLNQMLSTVRGKVTQDNQEKIKSVALEKLIDQTLVLQAAKQAKLDRTPEVLSALEAAKRKVLVDAYVKRTLQGVGKPTDSEIEKFYSDRPEIFAERHLFVYSQLTIPSKGKDLEELVANIKGMDSLDELTSWLSKEDVEYKFIKDAKTSEKLPAPLLRPLSTLKLGDLGYLKMSDGVLVVHIELKEKQPVSVKQASNAIAQQIYVQRQKEAAEKLVLSLKESAQLEYLGEFQKLQDK